MSQFFQKYFFEKSIDFDALYRTNGTSYFKIVFCNVKSSYFSIKTCIFKQLSIIISVQQVKEQRQKWLCFCKVNN